MASSMNVILKVLLAFGVGIGAMMGVQTLWLTSIKQQLASNATTIPKFEPKPFPTVDASKLTQALYPKIDPKIGQNAAIGTINRQISLSINAGKMVPLPPNIPGFRR